MGFKEAFLYMKFMIFYVRKLSKIINLCAKIDEKVVAYATTKFIDLDYLKKIIRDKKLHLDEEFLKIGYIDSIAVDENYSGYGIGTLLLIADLSQVDYIYFYISV